MACHRQTRRLPSRPRDPGVWRRPRQAGRSAPMPLRLLGGAGVLPGRRRQAGWSAPKPRRGKQIEQKQGHSWQSIDFSPSLSRGASGLRSGGAGHRFLWPASSQTIAGSKNRLERRGIPSPTSYAPPGLGVSGTVPHGLRRGLLSCAPSGLGRRIPRTSRNLPAGAFHEFPRAAGPLQQTRRSAPLGTQGRKTVSNAGESPRRILTPLRGWGVSGTVPHGLRRGHYLAPLRGWAGESLEHRGICLPAFFMNFRGPQALYNRPGGPPHWARTQTVIILFCSQVELAFLPLPRLRLAPWRAARSARKRPGRAYYAMAAAKPSWALR